jgi:hypothetical protein
LIKKGVFVIPRDPRAVIFQHPDSQLSYTIHPLQNSVLKFSTALSNDVWRSGTGDGVQFDIYITSNNVSSQIFSEYIDPKNILEDRRWHDQEVDLSPWAGKTITITFTTNCGPKNDCSYDWAGWGEPRIEIPLAYDFLAELPNAVHNKTNENFVRQDTLTINGDTREIIFEHPTSEIIYSITIPQQSYINFGLGMDPDVWSADNSDGVEYNIYLISHDQPNILNRVFHRYLDPANNQNDRKWIDQVVDLSKYGGQTVDIIFESLPGPNGNANFDWGGWSTPVIVTRKP